MITNVNKKVICVKDIPSNIIEEAIFILKTDVITKQDEKFQKKRREIATKEAENFLKDYIIQIQKNKDEYENEKNFNKTKLKIILVTIVAVVACYIISLIL